MRARARRAAETDIPTAEQLEDLLSSMIVPATAWSEPTLLRLAHAYEQAGWAHRPPAYRPADVGF
ncbi:hypothetical protein ACWD26_41855 [Streptomyces sp. NPDC002787]